ncbi:MAG TPA: copper-binding protein [Terriglobales bacterium]|nr:copper-binding protein [Terriglobales bacterium]
MKKTAYLNAGRAIAVCVAALLIATVGLGQDKAGKKALTFHGKVEAVEESAQSLKVNGEKVEGWMDAMTMSYKVDNPAILKKVKPGEQIMATVYEGDMILHNVRVMKEGAMKKKK